MLAQQPSKPFLLGFYELSIYAMPQFKMTSNKGFLSMKFCPSSLTVKMTQRRMCLRQKIMLRRLLVLTLLLSLNHQQTHHLPKKLFYVLSSQLNNRIDLVMLMSSKWFQAPPDALLAMSKTK